MGQEASCCKQKHADIGIERIFDNNYQINRETIQILGADTNHFNPYRKSKLIKLHKVQCEENQAKPESAKGNSIYHSRNWSTASQTLQESNFQRSGDNNQIRSSFDVKGNNVNGTNQYYSNNTQYNSTQETLNNFSSQPSISNNQYGSFQGNYVTSPSSYELDNFQQVAGVHNNNTFAAVVNSDQVYSVRETYLDGSTYEGEKVGEFRQGYGIFIFSNKACYKGNWSQDKMNGRGLLYYSSGQLAYQGQFAENKFQGYGYLNNEIIDYTLREDDDKYYHDFSTIGNKWIKYEGEFYNDAKNGRGRLYFSNGDFIQADFVEDKINGECILYKSNNQIVKGYWRENKLIRITY
ncbi:kinase domain protein (macronuclear) [Tetrahymena thermophila SB210]|uniref:Kinase domain protein n=1 Tax=Tetrahymena thermophila (strain SB210) TaxID=312017 RepID=I7LV94_TETTS|nr:kinase domain protein [Tetrahymena thermophila SB210]EAR97493.3 kinase domain protein [Tetrahymena thermophila SB210]|eukprot:XP_001017738.3 kinase domain protein [Tetrahymena thermophila SB210]